MLNVILPDEAATGLLGADIAAALKPGDVVALSGDLGAGKSTLARAAIRWLADEAALEVPSPTFTLVQSYAGRLPAHHFDLYRLSSPDELDELGIEEARDGVALVEWPERAEGRLGEPSLTVHLDHHGEGRVAAISGAAAPRVARSLAVRDFLARSGWGAAGRRYLQGDASTRAYETVRMAGSPERVLMNAPKLPDGPPIRNGLPYSRIAHLAESVVPFVAIDRALREEGFSAPEIFAQDLDAGLLVIEHLGSDGLLEADGRPVPERYVAAAELLAAVHSKTWPERLEAGSGVAHELPRYDRAALAIETELIPDWYMPHMAGIVPGPEARAAYAAAWERLFDRLDRAEWSLVLRDYHSPNIIWRGDRAGHDRIGIIDFQDAVFGPSAYDVASLAMDARVTVPPQLEAQIVAAYCEARRRAGPFDRASFDEAYAIMAAQRNSKILGIFVRLDRRDGKPHYLRHLPRIRDYLARAFAHPALAELARLYEGAGILERQAA